MEYISEHFQTIFDEITLRYPELDDKIAKSIAIVGILRTYQDVDNIRDMLKDGAFVKVYYNNAQIEFSKSKTRYMTNSILHNGKIKRECLDNNFELIINTKIIEGIATDY